MRVLRASIAACLLIGLAQPAAAVTLPGEGPGVAPPRETGVEERPLRIDPEFAGELAVDPAGLYYDVLVVADDEVLDALEVDGAHRFRSLPIARQWLTRPAIESLAREPGTRYIEPNRPIEFLDDDVEAFLRVDEVRCLTPAAVAVWCDAPRRPIEPPGKGPKDDEGHGNGKEKGPKTTGPKHGGGYDGSGIDVAVIDSGLWGEHPDIVGPLEKHWIVTDLAQHAALAPANPERLYVRTDRGGTAVYLRPPGAEGDRRPPLAEGPGAPAYSQRLETTAHGTAVAGIVVGDGTAAAAGDRTGAGAGERRTGVAPGARLHFYGIGMGTDQAAVISIIAGIDHAVGLRDENGERVIDVINLSVGQPTGRSHRCDFVRDAPYNVATGAAYEAGIVTVVSWGNMGQDEEGTCSSPGSAPYTLSVGATHRHGGLASLSARGCTPPPHVGSLDRTTQIEAWQRSFEAGSTYSDDIVGTADALGRKSYAPCQNKRLGLFRPGVLAPGVHVLTTSAPNGAHRYPLYEGPYYTAFSGTSAAAPVVSGVAALVLQAARSAGHDPQALDVMRIIEGTANHGLLGPLTDQVSKVDERTIGGAGVVDAARAVGVARLGPEAWAGLPTDLVPSGWTAPRQVGGKAGALNGTAFAGSGHASDRAGSLYGWHEVVVDRGVDALEIEIPADQTGHVLVRVYPPGRTDDQGWFATSGDLIGGFSPIHCGDQRLRVPRPRSGTWHVRVDGSASLDAAKATSPQAPTPCGSAPTSPVVYDNIKVRQLAWR